jgi:hypothetical protein
MQEHPWNFTVARTRLSAVATTTLTPGAGATVADTTGVTFTAGISTFLSTDVGYRIVGNSGEARITGYTSGTVVTGTIDTAFADLTTIAAGDWRIAPAWGHDYRYLLPTDAIRIMQIDTAGGVFWRPGLVWVDTAQIPFKIERGYILTDEGNALFVQYIADITDVTKYPPIFETAFVALLAYELSFPTTGNTQLSRSLYDVYRLKLAEARSIDGQEGTGMSTDIEDLIAVRF